MNGPTYDAQVAEIRRRGLRQAAIAVPLLALAMVVGIALNHAIGDHLGASLYEPACRAACQAAGGRNIGQRLGGRGHTGEVRCECADTAETWHEADLSSGSVGDKVLHFGGQEALTLLAFGALAMTGVVLGFRVGPRGPV